MENKILVICPTRTRYDKIHQTIEAFIKTQTGFADLLIAMDEDDRDGYTFTDYEHEYIKIEVNPRIRMIPTVNLVANKYCNEYKYIGFIGDDHMFRTRGWDKIFLDKLEEMKVGIVYGNDLLQGRELATAGFLTSNIVSTLGYIAIPELIHLYMDTFWMSLGRALGKLEYFEDVTIEHCHFTNGKGTKDDLYTEVNSSSMYQHDGEVYNKYCAERLESDVAKLRQLL
jgi:hypothetical protein